MSEIILDTGEKYTVTKIVCVGRNYAQHISEMQAQRTKEPVLFLKPPSSVVQPGQKIILPRYSSDIHHEVELALLVTKRARQTEKGSWRSYIGGFGVAIDLTLRDLQKIAKNEGLPWCISKGFDGSCPLSKFMSLTDETDLQNFMLKLEVNGETKQYASTSEMIFNPDELITYISGIFTLEPGDLVLTGTPEGVGPLKNGDMIVAEIENIVRAEFQVQSQST